MKMVKKLSQMGTRSTFSHRQARLWALRTAKVELPDKPLRHTLNP